MAAPLATLTGMNAFWRHRSTRNRESMHSASFIYIGGTQSSTTDNNGDKRDTKTEERNL